MLVGSMDQWSYRSALKMYYRLILFLQEQVEIGGHRADLCILCQEGYQRIILFVHTVFQI
jgi:hypothetical protein